MIPLLALIAITAATFPAEPKEDGERRPVVEGVATPEPLERALASPVSAVLVQHFRKHGISLRERSSDDGQDKIWIIDNLEVGPHCIVVVKFVRLTFEEPEAARNYLRGISLPSVLNEQEMVAMFYPWAQATTSDPKACDDWRPQMDVITRSVVEAFKSYDSTTKWPPSSRE